MREWAKRVGVGACDGGASLDMCMDTMCVDATCVKSVNVN